MDMETSRKATQGTVTRHIALRQFAFWCAPLPPGSECERSQSKVRPTIAHILSSHWPGGMKRAAAFLKPSDPRGVACSSSVILYAVGKVRAEHVLITRPLFSL